MLLYAHDVTSFAKSEQEIPQFAKIMPLIYKENNEKQWRESICYDKNSCKVSKLLSW